MTLGDTELTDCNNEEQDILIRSEQQVLDCLIMTIDDAILSIHEDMSLAQLQMQKAKEQNLSDTYGMLLSANNMYEKSRRYEELLLQVKDELYDTRIIVNLTEENGETEEEEIKIGLHELGSGGKIYVCSWKLPVCRHYLMDNSPEDFHGKVIDKFGRKYETDYHLKMKRKVTIHFDKVKKVTHLYPLTEEEAEHIISDEFLRTLLERRTEKEFQNIVFSIQKKQGTIIQLPYNENIIVQGCAGSGKSMIMLHRLPILLYDNHDVLEKNSIYVITPSKAYIQLADNLRIQLEISDLKMGTLADYYNDKLEKYGIKPSVYGRSHSRIAVTEEQEEYVYSNACILDIEHEINDLIDKGYYDFTYALDFFHLDFKINGSHPTDVIRQMVIATTHIVQANNKILKEYEALFKSVSNGFRDLHNMLKGRKLAIMQRIYRNSASVSRDIRKLKQEMEKLDPKKNEIAYKSRMQSLDNLQKRADIYNDDLYKAASDDAYFEQLEIIDKKLIASMQAYGGIKQNISNSDLHSLYAHIKDRERAKEIYDVIFEAFNETEEKYLNYTDSMKDRLQSIYSDIERLLKMNETYLSEDNIQSVITCKKYYEDLGKTLPIKVYTSILEKMGRKIITTKNGSLGAVAMDCSPYLFTGIVYMIQGAPNVGKEKLISIDEAQNLAPNELRLLKRLNNNDVIFNLYGDIDQHIEHTKGVDEWSDFDSIVNFSRHELNENYRNAKQITDYCNAHFNMNMLAINLPGRGVHDSISDRKELDEVIKKILTGAAHPGIKAIIVKTAEEAAEIMKQYHQFAGYLNDMENANTDIRASAWNIMTVRQAKGLEFNTVIALSGNMTRNEKYIAYTRALDELYIYEKQIQIETIPASGTNVDKIEKSTAWLKEQQGSASAGEREREKTNHHRSTTKKIVVIRKSHLRDFLIQQGCVVKDLRSEGGCLWVTGSKKELAPIIKRVGSEFGVTGQFMTAAKPIGNKPGWFTKSNK